MRNLQNVIGEYGLYDYNVTIVKEVGPCVKVTHLRSVRKSGKEARHKKKELERSVLEVDAEIKKAGEEKAAYIKLEAATSRAKTKVKEYALCNDWDYYVTLTLDKEKFGRYDLNAYHKAFAAFIKAYNRSRKDGDKVEYILIPEKHKDSAWHMHGFMRGIRPEDIIVPEFVPKRTSRGGLKYVRNTKKRERWTQYAAKFGYISMEKIRDKQRIANYITKYINKDIAQSVTEYGAHMYYCSRGLKTGVVIYKGTETVTVTSGWDYIRPDGFCKVKWYASADDFAADVRFGIDEVPGAVVDDDGNIMPDYTALLML